MGHAGRRDLYRVAAALAIVLPMLLLSGGAALGDAGEGVDDAPRARQQRITLGGASSYLVVADDTVRCWGSQSEPTATTRFPPPSSRVLASRRWGMPSPCPRQVSLSVDATSRAELVWSFSFGGSPTRWVSSQQFQTLDADIAADVAVFRTTFDDQVASVSGGKPDTAGTVTITCT